MIDILIKNKIYHLKRLHQFTCTCTCARKLSNLPNFPKMKNILSLTILSKFGSLICTLAQFRSSFKIRNKSKLDWNQLKLSTQSKYMYNDMYMYMCVYYLVLHIVVKVVTISVHLSTIW